MPLSEEYTDHTISFPKGLEGDVQRLCEEYETTIDSLVKGALRETIYYEMKYHALPAQKRRPRWNEDKSSTIPPSLEEE